MTRGDPFTVDLGAQNNYIASNHNPQIMTDTAHHWQYGAFYKSDNTIWAVKHHLPSDAIQTFDLGLIAGNPMVSPSAFPNDNHFCLSCAVDGDNIVHIMGNQHSGDNIGSRAHHYVFCTDIDNFQDPASWHSLNPDPFAAPGIADANPAALNTNANNIPGPAYTYVLMDRMSDGTVLAAMAQDDYQNNTAGRDWILWKHRLGSTTHWDPVTGDGNFATCYDIQPHTLNAAGHVSNADGSPNRVYMQTLYCEYRSGQTDRIHCSGLWRTGNDSGASMQKPWYIYSDDVGATWKTIAGGTQVIPIRWANRQAATVTSAASLPLGSNQVVTSDPAPNPPGLASIPLYMQGVTIDSHGYPHLVYCNAVDEFSAQHWYDCFWNGTAWASHALDSQPVSVHQFRGRLWTQRRTGDFTNHDTRLVLQSQVGAGQYMMGPVIKSSCTPNPDPVLLRDSGIYSIMFVENNVPTFYTCGNSKPLRKYVPPPPDTTPPSVPTGLTTSVSGNNVTLNWTASVDAGGGTVAGYVISRQGIDIFFGPGTSYVDSGLAAGSYGYQIRAYDNASPANFSGYCTSVGATIGTPTFSPPDTLDTSGGIDVYSGLQAFFDGLPWSTATALNPLVVVFPANVIYRCEQTLVFGGPGRTNQAGHLVLHGNSATLTHSTLGPFKGQVWIQTNDIAVDHLTVRGPNFATGADGYNALYPGSPGGIGSQYEGMHGWRIVEEDRITLDYCDVYNVYGDGWSFDGSARCTDCWVKHSQSYWTGRHGLNPNSVNNFLADQVTCIKAGRHLIDVEPDGAGGEGINGLTITNFAGNGGALGWFSAIGGGASPGGNQIDNIDLEDVTLTNVTAVAQFGRTSRTHHTVTIKNVSGSHRWDNVQPNNQNYGGGVGDVFDFTNTTGITVQNVHQPVNPTPPNIMYMVGCTSDCTVIDVSGNTGAGLTGELIGP